MIYPYIAGESMSLTNVTYMRGCIAMMVIKSCLCSSYSVHEQRSVESQSGSFGSIGKQNALIAAAARTDL